ncbi:hypothetical protein [Streptomyces roseicoloratus]|uniref:hypothetical protein n=1 Tax=Streptomyces roseicoloratus TaxID=2508722 RepID=UPI0010098A00|nr:hypothetical protein [Streptomyces roseicoloratus]
MTIHRPGLPSDLPEPALLWARWGVNAVVRATTAKEARGARRTGVWIDDEGLHLDDAGCTWWAFSRLGEGRWVLYGEDESSGCKWHKPPVDVLAGGPDWLPYDELRELLDGWELGCVYWYEDGAWSRAVYPEDLGDDGLDCGMSRFTDRQEALDLLVDLVGYDKAAAEVLLAAAEERRLTPELLAAHVVAEDGGAPDLPAMVRALERTGLGPAPGEGRLQEGQFQG